MKALTIIGAFSIALVSIAQQQKHMQDGIVYGSKPDKTGMMPASKVETFMGNKTRISTTIEGKVTGVTKQKGGWFNIDAGNGKIIAAHFSDYSVTIPMDLKGKTVIAQGIAAKQFIADDMQHMAGDTVNGKKQHTTNANLKDKLTFEVKGLVVEK